MRVRLFESISSSRDDIGRRRKKPAAPAAAARTGSGGWLKWLIGAAVVALLFFLLRGREPQAPGSPPPAATAASAQPAPVAAPASAPAARPAQPAALINRQLPDGSKIRIAPSGVEARLIDFIQDPSRPVVETNPFTLDRLSFEAGSEILEQSSTAQIDNMAAILRAFPTVTLKIGGFTDEMGEAAADRKLSADQATSVMMELVDRGIPQERLGAEGYGNQLQAGGGAAAEGRQANRRIEVRVTQK